MKDYYFKIIKNSYVYKNNNGKCYTGKVRRRKK